MRQAVVADRSQAPSLARLASRYGLRVAGDRPSLAAYTRLVWLYRHFIVAFGTAHNAVSVSTARLGRLWQVLTPLVNAAVYFVMFGLVLGTRAGIDNFPAYLCIGVFLFGFTQQVVMSGLRSIIDNLGLVRALHFPRASLPFAATLTQLQQLGFALGVLVIIIIATGDMPNLRWPLLVPVLVLQLLFSCGLGLAMARMGSRTADLKHLMPFVLRTWMYASGVFYPVSMFENHLHTSLATVLEINPLLVYLELARHALLESPPPPGLPLPVLWLVAGVWAAVVGIGGYVYFWLGEKEYGRG
ncbi:MAG TPA: ABC transporter permease [Micromonosporaceae bacterium]|jgi:teichoic acid transport system permease protein|nr:ABC transporter permease [Micromonosporaceae bacterium]